MTFRTHLIAGIGVLIAIMLFGAAISVTLWTAGRDAARTTTYLLDEMEESHSISLQAERLVAAARGYLVTRDGRELALVRSVAERLQRSLDEMSARDPDDALLTAAVAAAATDYVREVLAVSPPGAAAPLLSRTELESVYEQRLRPKRNLLRDSISSLSHVEGGRIVDVASSSERRVRGLGIILLGSCLVATLIGVCLAFIVSRRLSGAYARGQRATEDAARTASSRKDLLEMVSHDLRSPLGTILLGIDALRLEHGDMRQLRTLDQAAQRMKRLVEDLLDAARAETTGLELDLQPWRVSALFDIVRELFSARAQRGNVALTIDDSDLEVVVDRERVLQVLSNLIGNALSFTRAGGEVRIWAAAAGANVRFSVRDTGPGISESERITLFDAFRQGEEGAKHDQTRRGSVGLGLYIAKNLVQAHGGTIGVDSSVGGGTTFWFELPKGPGAGTAPVTNAANPAG